MKENLRKKNGKLEITRKNENMRLNRLNSRT